MDEKNRSTHTEIQNTLHVSYADLPEEACRKITALEQEIQKVTGEKVALVAYRV